MLLRKLTFVLALWVATAIPAAAVTLEYLTSPIAGSASWDVNNDGSKIAANYSGQFYFLDSAGNFSLFASEVARSSVAISDDGTVVATTIIHTDGIEIPAIMREADGWEPQILPVPAGYEGCDSFRANSYDISGDGTKVTGLVWDGCTGKAFLWTEATGMQDLGTSRGSAISGDGSTIVGFSGGSRRPVYWPITGDIGGSSVWLHHEEDLGEVFDVNSSGDVMVGFGLPYGYDPIYTGYQAFRYEIGDTNVTLLGTLSGNPSDISRALLIADNGVILGVSGPSNTNREAFIWTPTLGMTSLQQYLIDEGIEVPSTVKLAYPMEISSDGSTLIGFWQDIFGAWGYFRVNFGTASPVGDHVQSATRLTGVSPNPFNPMTTVSFALDRRQQATVSVYDIAGRKVADLADAVFEAGDHQIVWRGKDLSGGEAPSGTYIVRLVSGQGTDSQSISLIR